MADRYSKRRCTFVPLLLAACIAVPAGLTSAQQGARVVEVDDLRDLERAFVRLADRVRPSAVAIRTYSLDRFVTSAPGGQGRRESHVRMMPKSHGSGAVIRHDGFILTSTHVIQGADKILVVLHDGREFEARVVQADQRSDLAVLKIDLAGLHPVSFQEPGPVRQGQWCFVVGNPFGLANAMGNTAMTYGIVEALGRDLSEELNDNRADPADQRYYGDLIQTSAAINPGNSGGPVFNIDGEMIGLVAAIESSSGLNEGVGFAIPMDVHNRRRIDQLRSGQAVQYGYLGVSFDLSDTVRLGQRPGVRITELSPADGPAAKAGLKPDDVIVEFNGLAITSKDQLVRVVGVAPVGGPARVTYLRDGRRRTAVVTLGRRAVSPVALGSSSKDSGPPTCLWRGAWLQEPGEALLHVEGVARESAGLVVVEVEPGSDADRAGLKPVQMILAFDHRRVRTIEEFLAADEKAGEQVRLRVHTESGTTTMDMPRRKKSM